MNTPIGGRYALVRPLGEGGMGEVFLARDLATGRECALKLLHPGDGPAIGERVRAEFEALSRIRHASIVRVRDMGNTPEGRAYIVMDYVPGLAADRALAHGEWDALAWTAWRICDALVALHAAGVVHGDLKPANVLVTPALSSRQRPLDVRVVDFGLATVGSTAPGRYAGTVAFAAPEIGRGAAPDAASDLYSLGATLWTLITGAPLASRSRSATRTGAVGGHAVSREPLERAGAPAKLVHVVMRLLSESRAERLADAAQARREFEALLVRPQSLAARIETLTPIGREAEFARFERALAAAVEGAGALRVGGPPGSGRTTWLDQLALRARLSGHPVARAAGADGGEPLSAARSITRQVLLETGRSLDLPGDALAAETPPTNAALGTLVGATIEALSSIGRRNPTLVLIDDAHLLDESSHEYLRRATLHEARPPALWVWASDGDPRIDTLVHAGEVEGFSLPAFDKREVARLADARLGQAAPLALKRFLWDRAEGHAALTMEALRQAIEAGALREVDGVLTADAAALAALPRRGSHADAWIARARALPPADAQVLLRVAAEARPVSASEVANGDPSGLERLESRGFLRRTEGPRWTLSSGPLALRLLAESPAPARHAAARDALATEGLGAIERWRLHRLADDASRALAALAESPESAIDVTTARDAARLARELGRNPDAGRWHLRAAAGLRASGEYGAAAADYEAALESLPDDERELAWEGWVLALVRSGRGRRALDIGERAVAGIRRPTLRARARANLSLAAADTGNGSLALEHASAAQDEADRAGDPGVSSIAALTRSTALAMLGRPDEADRALEEAIESGGLAHEPLDRLRVRGWLAMRHLNHQRWPEALAIAHECIEHARAAGLALPLLESLGTSASASFQSGDWNGAAATSAEMLRTALESHARREAGLALSHRSLIESLRGDPRAGLDHARAVFRMFPDLAPSARADVWRLVALAHRTAGRLDRAERALGHARLPQAGHAARLWAANEHIEVLATRGAWNDVRAMAIAARRFADADANGARIRFAWIGRAALRADDLTTAAAALADIRGVAGVPNGLARAHEAILDAELAFARGERDTAIARSRHALELLEALPAPHAFARAAYELAGRALAVGFEAPIDLWLRAALERLERIDDRTSREQVLRRLVESLSRQTTTGSGAAGRGLLEAVGEMLHSLSDLPELTRRAMQLASRQLGAERGVLLLVDPETQKIVPMAEFGEVDATARRNALGYSRHVIRIVTQSGSSVVVSDPGDGASAPYQTLKDMRKQSALAVPMFLGGRVVGAVYLDHSQPQAFDENDRGLLEGFAHLMAVAIERSRGEEEVRRANEQLIGENLSLRREVGTRFRAPNVIGGHAKMQHVMSMLELAARTSTTVLLTGETGTGKELIARTLHQESRRRLRNFLTFDCSLFTETLLESDLYGILGNVASGVRARPGIFEQADGGTVFLDEIGEMPLVHQSALLRVLQNREVTPVGSFKPIPVDVRIIAATHRDLRQLVQENLFRTDLYYRLAVFQIEVPPLRERKSDIPAIAQHYLAQFAERWERPIPEMSPDFMATLMRSDWPGNVRELVNYIERLMAMNTSGVLRPHPLPRDLEARDASMSARSRLTLREQIAELEARAIQAALEAARGNQSQAARALGLTEQTLRYKLKHVEGAQPRKKARVRHK